MNTNFKEGGLTRLGIKPKSTAYEADTLTTRPSELLEVDKSSGGVTCDSIKVRTVLTVQLYCT